MIKIRGKCFETNSSSMDRYDDYDDRYDDYDGEYSIGSVYGRTFGFQNVVIELETKDNLTKEEEKQMEDIESIEKDILEVISSYISDSEGYEITSYGDDYIIVSVRIDAVAKLRRRYEPHIVPDIEFEYDEMSHKNEENHFIENIRKELLDVFKKAGWTGITDIIRVYGDEIDEDEFYNNLDN